MLRWNAKICRCCANCWTGGDVEEVDGGRALAYQRHVIMDFTRVPNPKYTVDPDLLIAMYGHRIFAGQGETDAFVSWIDGATAKG